MTETTDAVDVLIGIAREQKRALNQRSLKDVVGDERWVGLEPNYPMDSALLPRELTSLQVEELIASVADPELLDAMPWERAGKAFTSRDVTGVGRLEKIGGGEQKVCYVLTTESGKSMAILLRGYDGRLGTTIPEDPKLTLIKTGPKSDIWEYSDLRTYLMHPVSSSLAVQLQEFGGRNSFAGDLTSGEIPGAISFARGRASAHVAGRGSNFSIDQHELNHPRHFLFNQGTSRPPAIIDIPVIQRK